MSSILPLSSQKRYLCLPPKILPCCHIHFHQWKTFIIFLSYKDYFITSLPMWGTLHLFRYSMNFVCIFSNRFYFFLMYTLCQDEAKQLNILENTLLERFGWPTLYTVVRESTRKNWRLSFKPFNIYILSPLSLWMCTKCIGVSAVCWWKNLTEKIPYIYYFC